ncbi:hypothetical protein SAMD00019534_039480 [Acytostelium subglobosum LB1]|uniref:hypothetical protein n=1 Tax=Acytostelium subglobosum LB1 TaxID=1410327 RepID=UPI0006449FCC|nr:hypothetical protein SAMD00019534_039480 [Acytostelium subglobosum LB1]GAM20773.1 hypothetical protein SAMD00019534_039480 [Acytostelium subglobosum LB1]|eukprot:XP_012755907.1 hypothetical protein SAMD00019534_039480 [Acytostelium subglobosum LB1]
METDPLDKSIEDAFKTVDLPPGALEIIKFEVRNQDPEDPVLVLCWDQVGLAARVVNGDAQRGSIDLIKTTIYNFITSHNGTHLGSQSIFKFQTELMNDCLDQLKTLHHWTVHGAIQAFQLPPFNIPATPIADMYSVRRSDTLNAGAPNITWNFRV